MGQAYHAGVLAALQLDLGWDARGAEIVVGTSAGAITGAMLRLDISPFDLASWVLGHTWGPDQPILQGFAAIRNDLPPLSLRDLMRPWRLPAIKTWIPMRRRPWSLRPMAIASSMVPNGKTGLEGLVARHMDGRMEEGWPKSLWICAVRKADGRRVVFGQEPYKTVRLSSAIAASACIPGYFTPVTIGGQQFLDGGIHSPTNADLLVSQHLDLAIIVSPMSGRGGRFDKGLRLFAQRRVQAEIDRLERAGTNVVLFEPGCESTRAMGMNPMARNGVDRVVQAAFFEAGSLAAQSDIRQCLLPIAVAR
jgi:NTE family protein